MTLQRVLIVSGLSGAGKASILRALEDLGYEAVDNPPLHLLEDLVSRAESPLAIGLDARSRGFDSHDILQTLHRIVTTLGIRPELIYASADETVLLRRFTETRRRHPLAPHGRVTDGIAAEMALTAPLRDAADLVLDTSGLPLAELRRVIEARYRVGRADQATQQSLTVALISFAFPAGLPREADMVFDARFLRNPHYDPALRDRTGLDLDVAAYVETDPSFPDFFTHIIGLLRFLLPRFIAEGKKYVTIGVGCTGGRHRSVWIVEKLAQTLSQPGRPHDQDWNVLVRHRELSGPEAPTRHAHPADAAQP